MAVALIMLGEHGDQAPEREAAFAAEASAGPIRLQAQPGGHAGLMTTKPFLYVFNVDDRRAKELFDPDFQAERTIPTPVLQKK